MSRISKLQRWLDLIAHLVGRRLPVPRSELMERVPAYARRWEGAESDRAAARRMFERDKDELRELGIPIETVTYSVNYGTREKDGYRLARSNFYLPYLKLASEAAVGEGEERTPGTGSVDSVELTAEEAAVSVDALRRVSSLRSFPLRREARSALRKLTFDLSEGIEAETPVHFAGGPDAGTVAARLRTLSDALLDRKRVEFSYRGMYRDEVTRRDVAPYGLFFQHGHWYLIGSDARRDDETRVFRADRMEEVEPNTRRPGTPDYEIPESFTLVDYLDREAWELGQKNETTTAEVRFRFPASLRVARQGRGELVEDHDDGSSVRRFEVRQVDPFLRWLLTFRGDADVVEPPGLKADLRTLARSVVETHTGPPDGSVEAGGDW